MSTCISRHGEYGDHMPGEGSDRFICQRCFAFDEEAAEDAIDALDDLLRNAARERDEWEANAEQANQTIERVCAVLSEWGSEPPHEAAAGLWRDIKGALGSHMVERRICPNGCGTSWTPSSVTECPTCDPSDPLEILAGVPDALGDL